MSEAKEPSHSHHKPDRSPTQFLTTRLPTDHLPASPPTSIRNLEHYNKPSSSSQSDHLHKSAIMSGLEKALFNLKVRPYRSAGSSSPPTTQPLRQSPPQTQPDTS